MALLIAFVCTGCALIPRPGDAPQTVRIDTGVLRGVLSDRARLFYDIPYAAPPVGPLRWELPQRPGSWTGERAAKTPGVACLQEGSTEQLPSSEDCLYLNVTTPREVAADAQLPVMVWWHGGGFTRDAGNYYDAQRLADRGQVVVITANYRLGIFGYLGLPGLEGSGNFGLADQLATLEWAKRNAGVFGGDPDNVTVFGQSAGAMSACAALTAPRAAELIDKVALASGSCKLSWPAGGLYPKAPAQQPYVSLERAQADGLVAARELGCSTDQPLECLREKKSDELLPVNQGFANHVAHGTELLPRHPATALDQGRFARVPVLSGGTRDEARSFVGGAIDFDPATITATTYPTLLRRAFGDDGAAVANRYPLARFPSAGLAWATVLSDQSWACPTQEAQQRLAEHTTVFPYEFADPQAPNLNKIKTPEVPQGAAHGTDLPSLFDLFGIDMLPTDPQQQLSETMIDYWATFARTGDPNHDGAPRWTRADDHGRALRLAPSEIAVADVAADHQCSFWAELGRGE
ncbi:carboxylesterase/lipase family protein [Microlunatus speluncae]|uniref:carboxylesterase/lipase family protein n=1 Tax=Microlunatus speluncae TaxID=2594267 RepID=UPI0013759973|nr:carboxylesterase family protein [Microlunatus speluncae]